MVAHEYLAGLTEGLHKHKGFTGGVQTHFTGFAGKSTPIVNRFLRWKYINILQVSLVHKHFTGFTGGVHKHFTGFTRGVHKHFTGFESVVYQH